MFGGLPVQHREVQGFESVSSENFTTMKRHSALQKRFKDQFPDGIMIKKGGMESGLKKAETNAHEAKLFKISGGMRPVMQEVSHGRSSLGQMILEMSEKYCLKSSKRY